MLWLGSREEYLLSIDLHGRCLPSNSLENTNMYEEKKKKKHEWETCRELIFFRKDSLNAYCWFLLAIKIIHAQKFPTKKSKRGLEITQFFYLLKKRCDNSNFSSPIKICSFLWFCALKNHSITKKCPTFVYPSIYGNFMLILICLFLLICLLIHPSIYLLICF